MALVVFSTCAHEVHQIGVSDFDKRGDFPLELLCHIAGSTLSICWEPQLLNCDVILLVSPFPHISTRTSTYLLFKPDVLKLDPEMTLRFAEFLCQYFIGNLCRLCQVGTLSLKWTSPALQYLATIRALALLGNDEVLILPLKFFIGLF